MQNRINLTDLKPDICAGFTLCGYKVENGYRLGSKDGELVTHLPDMVDLNYMTYTYESIKIEDDGFFNAEYV